MNAETAFLYPWNQTAQHPLDSGNREDEMLTALKTEYYIVCSLCHIFGRCEKKLYPSYTERWCFLLPFCQTIFNGHNCCKTNTEFFQSSWHPLVYRNINVFEITNKKLPNSHYSFLSVHIGLLFSMWVLFNMAQKRISPKSWIWRLLIAWMIRYKWDLKDG